MPQRSHRKALKESINRLRLMIGICVCLWVSKSVCVNVLRPYHHPIGSHGPAAPETQNPMSTKLRADIILHLERIISATVADIIIIIIIMMAIIIIITIGDYRD